MSLFVCEYVSECVFLHLVWLSVSGDLIRDLLNMNLFWRHTRQKWHTSPLKHEAMWSWSECWALLASRPDVASQTERKTVLGWTLVCVCVICNSNDPLNNMQSKHLCWSCRNEPLFQNYSLTHRLCCQMPTGSDKHLSTLLCRSEQAPRTLRLKSAETDQRSSSAIIRATHSSSRAVFNLLDATDPKYHHPRVMDSHHNV